jgi:hypothetical protein
MTIGMVKGELPESTFQLEKNKNEVNFRNKLLKSVDYIKWFP